MEPPQGLLSRGSEAPGRGEGDAAALLLGCQDAQRPPPPPSSSFSSSSTSSSFNGDSEALALQRDASLSFHSAESGAASPPCSEGGEWVGGGGGGGGGCSSSSSSLPPQPRRPRGRRLRQQVVKELEAQEIRWFYLEERKVWRAFIGYDSLRLEQAFRAAAAAPQQGPAAAPQPVCVRGGLYEVNVLSADSYPVYWNQTETEKIPVMRGQWFIDGTWQPLEEEESNLIEQEHLNHFRGQQLRESFDMEVSQPADGREVIHSLKLNYKHVDWHSVDEVYLYSDAATSKIARTVKRKLGFSKASSSGTRLHRGYVEEATLEDKPPETSHIVFVVHGIGQKMDQGRIIKNTALMRDNARKIEEKCFPNLATRVEFLPVEWRSKLTLDKDTVDSITPDTVRGLRAMLNSSAMDIMYYTSPFYRDELVGSLQQELNRLYTLFCSRNPEFEKKGGKVSIVSHSLGCVIAYDVMTGWNPVRFYEQLLQREEEEEELEDRRMSYEERCLLEELHLAKQRSREIEERLHELRASAISNPPVLKFKNHRTTRLEETHRIIECNHNTIAFPPAVDFPSKLHKFESYHKLLLVSRNGFLDNQVENFFCMGSPLAVFLALRGIQPGNSGSQDHILPRATCNRLLNIFHPSDPVAYRLEPLILKHYSTIPPVQIHWYDPANLLPYDDVGLSFSSPTNEPTSFNDSESGSAGPSPTTSPVMARRRYGESITNIGRASMLGAASIGMGLRRMLFSRFTQPSTTTLQPLETGTDGAKEDDGEAAPVGTPPLSPSTSAFPRPTAELEHRIDFELREGLVGSRYLSAVTSHTAYWSSMDIALFLLKFLYKDDQEDADEANLVTG